MPRRLRFGLYYDFRNPPGWRQDPARLYAAVLDQVVRAETLGWDDVWISEHHFCDDDYTPSVLPLAAAIAARTTRIRIGTGVLLLPLHDPVRVAEDAATVDVLSGGRLELGVGAGYRAEDFAGFGVPREERGARMNEAVSLLQRLFRGERFAHGGRHYRTGEIALRPRPLQDPLPIWMAGVTEPAVKRAARLGCHFLGLGVVRPFADLYRSELERHGRDPAKHEIASALSWLLVSRDPERRWREAEKHFAYQIGQYAAWTREAGLHVFAPPRSRGDLEAQGCLIVTPVQACAVLEQFAAESGLDRFYSWTVPPGLPPEWSDEHVELMAKEVIPEFR